MHVVLMSLSRNILSEYDDSPSEWNKRLIYNMTSFSPGVHSDYGITTQNFKDRFSIVLSPVVFECFIIIEIYHFSIGEISWSSEIYL